MDRVGRRVRRGDHRVVVVEVSGGGFVLAIILLGIAFAAMVAFAWDERLRAEEDAKKRRQLLSELARHPSSAGTEFCPMCREKVGRCLCE